jgi:periplasmic protein CpxP/Spy
MRTWIKRSLIALFGVGILAGGVAAFGHRHHHGGMHAQWSTEDVAKWRGKVIERAGSKLELDAAQKQRLGTLFDRLNEQRSALVGNSGDPRAVMSQLVAGSTFDRSRASALIDEKTAALRGKSPEVVTALADFYDSLRPEQQARVREYLNKRGGWRG